MSRDKLIALFVNHSYDNAKKVFVDELDNFHASYDNYFSQRQKSNFAILFSLILGAGIGIAGAKLFR